jgi:glutamine synthetase
LPSPPIQWDSTFDERVAAQKAQLIEKGVEHCFATWSDLHGRSKAKFVPVDRFDVLARGSEAYTVQAFEGMGPFGPHVPDQIAIPDLDSLVICPWDPRLAWMASDLYWKGEPYEYCSRGILKRQIAEAASQGYAMKLGVEPEFYVLRDTGGGALEPLSPADHGPCWAYDVEKTLDSMGFLEVVAKYISELGWELHSYDHEGGHGQYEFDFGFTDVLEMCDRFVFLRLMLKEVAKTFGAFATFMPKPFASDFRSGSHYNMSLFDVESGMNLMAADDDPFGIGFSSTAYGFVGGLLEHSGALMAVCCPTVNSYKGFVPGGIDPTGIASDMSWAPIYAAYGDNNRAAMLRLPNGRPCVENRTPDMAHNPYWAAALSLGAGLEGVLAGADPGPPANRNLYEAARENGAAAKVRPFPGTLIEAVAAFRDDKLTGRVFGEGPKAEFVSLKTKEWNEYHGHISEWERDRYLAFF